jgi:hypothetical protein
MIIDRLRTEEEVSECGYFYVILHSRIITMCPCYSLAKLFASFEDGLLWSLFDSRSVVVVSWFFTIRTVRGMALRFLFFWHFDGDRIEE